ncbi:hypothetical protein VP01_18g12 [Puccinia sorghi]|uniref:Reverse transcriptase domain-containing protein n=1 Tax=Puccinia sorghi TaxID=27349 RepID=A0A0L6VCT2_9BASI|nr:hypothetical protein VP01_18g12 [Puccinia sorghi]
MVNNVTVEKSLFNISDHWPVIQTLTVYENIKKQDAPKTKVWNRKGIDGHGWDLALSNRWNVLDTEEIKDESQLNETAKWWVDTLNAIGEETHLLDIPSEQRRFKFDKATLKLIRRSRRSRKKLEEAQKNTATQLDASLNKLRTISVRDQHRTKLAIRKFAKRERLRKSQKINDLLLQNEGQDFHRLIQLGQGKQQGKMDNAPCFNEHGVLVTSTEDILKARAVYSAQLASDPSGISTDPTKWTHVKPKEKHDNPPPSNSLKSTTDDFNETFNSDVILGADEFLMAIRQIQRNAAPGKSGVLAMHLKKFLEIECQLQISKDWEGAPKYGSSSFPKPLDYSTVALDRWSLPHTLLTPPLKHLLNIMRGCLRLKTQPKIWNEEVLITLPKPGQDQRWLKNTRGITLSCTEGKLLLTILASKISKNLEKKSFFSKAQAGFRKGQEAVAHVVGLSEILKRRSNNNQNTFAIYVDFKKAFDRVPHEGLWAKLRQIGIHNDLVEIIKKGYDSSKIQCRLGDNLSDPFTREIGTRQGCPLSPLLFIIFVNDIFEQVTEGINVPGLNQRVPGLLFADDTLLFADNIEEIRTILERLESYCDKWNFALGHEKCGIVQYGPPDSLVKDLPTEIQLRDGSIKFVNTYKYLGCWITNKWQKTDPYLMEREHAKTLAIKTNKCFFSSLPLLHDKELHLLCKTRLIQTYIMAIGSYGAEWIAMNQKRTCKIQSTIDKAMRVAYGNKSTSLKLNSLLLCTELGITPYSIHSTKQRIRLWHKRPHIKTILENLINSPAYNSKGKTWVLNTKRNLDILVRGADIIEDKYSVDENILHRVAWIQSMRDLKLTLHPPALKPEGSAQKVTQAQREERKLRDSIHNYLLHREFERESKRNIKVRQYDLYGYGRTANFIATSIHVPRVHKGVQYLKGETMMGDKHIYILLLGGLLRELYPDSSLTIGIKDEPYVETTYGRQDLTQWVNGFGHIPHIYPRNGAHGYVAISAYLQEVAPKVEQVLHRDTNPLEVASQLLVSDTGPPLIQRPNESPPVGATCPFTSNKARPNGMPEPSPMGVG